MRTTTPQNRKSERGNVLWFILLAIALLGILTIVLSRGGSSVDQSGDVEQQRVRASEIMRYAKGIEVAVEQMTLRGVSENDLSFANSTTATDYTNANCTETNCLVFDAGGGGQNYMLPAGGTNDGSNWIFTGANNVGTAANPVGTTAAVSGNDLVMLLPNITSALCIQINRELAIGTAGAIPTDATGIATTAFTGTFAGGSVVIIDADPTPFELDGKRAGCFTDVNANPDVNYYYHVLLAR